MQMRFKNVQIKSKGDFLVLAPLCIFPIIRTKPKLETYGTWPSALLIQCQERGRLRNVSTCDMVREYL